MFNFNFYTPTRVVFGKETEYRIGKLVKNVNCKKSCSTTEAAA